MKTNRPTPNLSEPKTTVNGRPKMIKTQGSNEYQNVHCGLQDKAGNLWFGTTGEGVYRYNGKTFTQFTTIDGLSNNKVWSILEDKAGNIWFGTDAGICRYDGRIITSIKITDETSIVPTYTSNANAASENIVSSIMQDKSGTIWFGTANGLYCYNGKTFTRFPDNRAVINKSGLTLRDVQCMLEDKKGNIWFGSGLPAKEGIVRYDGKTIEHFKPKNEGWIRGMVEEKNGSILFTTRSSGVCRYDGTAFTFSSPPMGIVNGYMMGCLEDGSGNTWFASDYGTELNDSVGGAWRYDGKSFTKYSTKDGLINNAVFLILEDRDGNIWLGTRNIGLYRFNGKTFTSYSE